MWWSFNSRPYVEDARSRRDAASWRARADEIRTWAARSWDPEIRTELLEIADCYERLAATASNAPSLAPAP